MATQAINYDQSISEASTLRAVIDQDPEPAGDIIGVSRWAQKARELVVLHSGHDCPVILEGEIGTGRRFLARLIHRASGFRQGPFLSLALGGASDDLAQTVLLRLLGKSGADSDPIEGIRGGTVYIEDLNNASMLVCSTVLRRAGRPGPCDGEGLRCRILIGRTALSDGERWRAAFAGNGLDCERIQIPPLRHRAEDIEPLVAHFIKQYCDERRRELPLVTPEAMKALSAYDWPRNISELKAMLSRVIRKLNPPSIDALQLPTYLNTAQAGGRGYSVNLAGEVERYEISLICAALRDSCGRQNRAARMLGIKPTTLFMKLKRYNIDADFYKPAHRPSLSSTPPTHRALEETR